MTGPYMHNGSAPTLRDAIRRHIDPPSDPTVAETLSPDARPLRDLTSDELSDLEAFLASLSSRTEEEVTFGDGVPREVPSGLPTDVGF